MSAKKEFAGKQILEVWDFRLSTAHPLVRNDVGDTWLVEIWANKNPDYVPAILAQKAFTAEDGTEYPAVPAQPEQNLSKPLEVHDTGIPCEVGDHWDAEKMKACYEWLYSVRDKYSRDHIELRKPVCKLINEANAMSNQILAEATTAKADSDLALYHQKIGELKTYTDMANIEIKKATKVFHDQVSEIEGGAE